MQWSTRRFVPVFRNAVFLISVVGAFASTAIADDSVLVVNLAGKFKACGADNPGCEHISLYGDPAGEPNQRSEEHTSELQSHVNLVCRLLLEKKNKTILI